MVGRAGKVERVGRVGRAGAMLRSVFVAAVWARRRALAWWVGGSFAYLLFLGSVFPTFRENAADFEDVLNSYPEALRALFNIVEGAGFGTGPGFFHMELFSFMIPLLLITFSIGFGARAIAGEEEEGILDLLLSTPLTRRRVIVEQFGAMVATTFVIGVAMGAAIVVAGAAFDMGLELSHIVAAMLASVLIALLFGSVALAAGAATGRRGLAIGVAGAAAVAAYLIFALAELVPWLHSAQKASPWYYYAESAPMLRGFEWAHLGILAAMVAVLFVAGGLVLDRRDLAV